jgi:hypothetical protein
MRPKPLLEVKDDDITASLYDPDEEQARLLLLFDDRYLGMLQAVHEATAEALDLEDFRLDDSAARRILLEAASRVVRIDETTRKAIAERLQQGQMLGLSNWELANGAPDKGYAGIEGLFRETWKGRAETVARTELAHAQLRSAVDRYQASGLVQEVQLIDGDYDETCQGRNGKRVALSQVPGLAHPNCTLIVVPLLRDEVLG